MSDLLRVNDLKVDFNIAGGVVKAVDRISYGVGRGETIAVVGESGSGKSVSALAIMGLLPSPPASVSGSVHFEGRDLIGLGDDALRRVRGSNIGMVFQEPMTSLNPLLSIGTQLREGMELHLGLSTRQADTRAVELLQRVGISDPRRRLRQYPHQFSGGMRQRVMIAIALSCEPKLLIADEPTTALDVTIQAQILDLIKALTNQLGVALVLITHNLGVVARYATRVNVMYAGRIVESGTAAEVFANPKHPYTVGLLACVPRMDRPRGERLIPIKGQPPDLAHLDSGCAYRSRCQIAQSECANAIPPLQRVGEQRTTACFRWPHI